jgi:hypothetical protein
MIWLIDSMERLCIVKLSCTANSSSGCIARIIRSGAMLRGWMQPTGDHVVR